MKNILIRSLSGAVYVALILGTLVYSNLAFSVVLFLFNIVGLKEFFTLKDKKLNWLLFVALGAVIFIVHSLVIFNVITNNWVWIIALAPILISINALFFQTKSPDQYISTALFGLLYVSLPLILINQLNLSSGNKISWLVLVVFVLVWVNDTFAFLAGLSFGKNKLFERISPKKTWEGFFGGLLATLIVAWFFFPLVGFTSRIQWMVLAALIVLFAVSGDFVESMLKRNAGVKDSGNIIPGHGGILDRLDSILFVFPLVFVYIQVFL